MSQLQYISSSQSDIDRTNNCLLSFLSSLDQETNYQKSIEDLLKESLYSQNDNYDNYDNIYDQIKHFNMNKPNQYLITEQISQRYFEINQEQSYIDFGFQLQSSEYLYSKIDTQIEQLRKKHQREQKIVKIQDMYMRKPHTQCIMMLNKQRDANFCKNTTKTIQEIKQLQNNKKLCMSYGRYTSQQIYCQFQQYQNQSKQITCVQSLYLAWTKIPKVVNLISRRVFKDLKALHIGGNNLQSIECLTKLQAYALQELWCWNNQICQFKSLRKSYFPNLKIMDFNTNKMIQTDSFKQIPSKKLQRMNFDTNMCINFSGFISLMSKMPKSKLNLLQNRCPKIMGQPKNRRRQEITSIKPSMKKAKYT